MGLDGKIMGFFWGFEQLWKFEWENNPCIVYLPTFGSFMG
jgi:hypothetical protein